MPLSLFVPLGVAAVVLFSATAAAQPVHLSVVLCARNDNHAGDFLDRLRWSIFSISLGLCRYRSNLNAEIVVVEWRPLRDTAKLSTLISQWMVDGNHNQDFDCQASTMPPVRIISVSDGAYESAFPEAARLKRRSNHAPVSQWQCKAIGLRRASGEFLVTTNADTIWSPQLFRFLSAIHFMRRDSFYVTHTVEFEGPLKGLHAEGFPFFQLYDEIFSGKRPWHARMPFYMSRLEARYPVIQHEASSFLCVNSQSLLADFRREEFSDFWLIYDHMFGVRLGVSDPSSDPEKPPCAGRFWNLFDSQPGDFILAPREAWHRVRGPPALPQNMYVDYLVICRLATFYRQVVLSNPCFMYHQAHVNSTQRSELAPPSELEGGRLELRDDNVWPRCCRPFAKFPSELVQNSTDWGLGATRLPEAVVQYKRSVGANGGVEGDIVIMSLE